MIKRLAIENFKSIRDLEFECKRVNVFIGEANTGKSNILEALGLLSFMAYGGRFSDYVRMAMPHQLFHNYDVEGEIKIAIDERELTGQFDKRAGEALFRGEDTERILCISSGGPSLHRVMKMFSFIRFYRFRRDIAFSIDDRPFLLPPDGRNLPVVLALNPSLKSLVQDFFEAFDQKLVLDEFQPSLSVMWEFRGDIRLLPYELVSDTLRRLIFHLAAVESNEDAVITMEEPEAHAFPTYTKYLAERIAMDKRNQYFITTHNPYFLLSLIEKTPVKDLAVYITYLAGYETKAKLLSEEELEDLFGMTSDVFFNLDIFVPGEEA